MSFARVFSAQNTFIDAHIVSVEADITKKTLQKFSVVGLPDKAVEESRDRVAAAIGNSGFASPKGKNQKVVVSLAPADLKKEGPLFDLAIALAYLLSAEELFFDSAHKIFLGELGLNGELRPIRGVLTLVQKAVREGFREAYVPAGNAREAALIAGITIYGVHTLRELAEHLAHEYKGEKKSSENGSDPARTTPRLKPRSATVFRPGLPRLAIDFSDIKGQESAKKGLEYAAAGGHNIALYGPAGTGKTMLAKALAGIIPDFTFEDALETTAIHSVAGLLNGELVTHPPFRAPHHTSSYVAMVGGGATVRPGEVTLAHRGILFLDEFPEFDRKVLDVLREPLEDRVVSVSRAKGSARFPASFILVAALNPCPCGNFRSREECVCSPMNLARYERRLSGPIIDRIDMWIHVPKISHKELGRKREEGEEGETSAEVKVRVSRARARQRERFAEVAERRIAMNSEMGAREINRFVPLSQNVTDVLNRSAESLNLSARAYHRTIKLARTIADLDESDEIIEDHVLNALQYRSRDRVGMHE